MSLNETYIEIKIENIFSDPLHCWDDQKKERDDTLILFFNVAFNSQFVKFQLNRKD